MKTVTHRFPWKVQPCRNGKGILKPNQEFMYQLYSKDNKCKIIKITVLMLKAVRS